MIDHRNRMWSGIRHKCSRCATKGDGVRNEDCRIIECEYHKWISRPWAATTFREGELATSVCRMCFSVCGLLYALCENTAQAVTQCPNFIAKQSAVSIPGDPEVGTKFEGVENVSNNA